ncbi:MAG: response regulator [Candidatus Aureabacteria bacterium]|nr:response regulator [Candidatus Auribacterota bacterium]
MLHKILVVDDEDVVLTFMKEALEEHGYNVLLAGSAREALSVLHEDKDCRMVICDIKMPDMDGLELLEKLRRERPNVVILMMTAYASWETVTISMQKGAYDYIRKPFSIEEILQSIENAWRRFQLENENARLKTLLSLFDISKIMSGAQNLKDVSRETLSSLLDHLDASRAAVVFYDESGKAIHSVYSEGKSFEWRDFLSGKPCGKTKVFYTSDTNVRLLPEKSPDIPVIEDSAILGMELGILSIPLEHRDFFLGVLFIAKDFNENSSFLRSDIEFLSIISKQLSILLANARLYNLLQDKVSELQETNKMLEETQLRLIQSAKLASAGELAAGIAHEIGNPVFSIRGTAELLLSRRERYGFSKEVVESLDVIRRQAVRAQEVANSLMTFSQKRDFDVQALDINAIIKDTLSLMMVLFVKAKIEVKSCLEEGISPVFGDRSQISQVIFNILLNARDALEEQGGTVIISTRESGGKIFVEITDNGPGIEEENVSKIFFPFFTTKDVNKGHGLGLSISYGIVEKHKGQIQVESLPGKKTVFTVELPVDKPKSEHERGLP